MNNSKVIKEWTEVGGVLGYDPKRNRDVSLYIMDDGEFEDIYTYTHTNMAKDEFARFLCESALRNANYSDEKIEKLMDWE